VETINFAERLSVEFVEEGNILAPKFNKEGILPVVVTETKSGMVLMIGYMNKDALDQTILTKQGHYWSRSREVLWKKGESSGMVHNVDDILIDDDQDSIWLKVTIEGLGASCHVGYKSCFYRSVNKIDNGEVTLNFTETEKVFDPEVVYPGADNPTKL
jgi:phosphoribosyl-AMP cyclohydrolase|tara:strand:- start:4770 stop:5243 length:474 start_codon:yes stop_codon:yes gene_type:complete